MTYFGSHLLGRFPRHYDGRDYRMSTVLALESPPTELDLALDALLHSWEGKATKRWAKIVTAQLKGSNPPAPTPAPPPVPVDHSPWADGEQLDQGQTGHCVGFGWAQWGNTLPVNDNFNDADGHSIYYECKVIDGEPGAENGSDVRSGAQAMKRRGRVDAYVFATTQADIEAWVQTKGPVVIGTNWYNDMFTPDAGGFVIPTGALAGGHCYILVDWDSSDVLTFQNSWGASWGSDGYFKMFAGSFASLMSQQGDACAGLELP